jgi:hypothetical protein
MPVDISRRSLLGLIAIAPLGALAAKAQTAPAACYDPASLPAGQKSLRRSLDFQEKAPDPAKRCGDCAFFKPSQGDCGACQILSGPTTAGSVCNSWAAKG